MERGIPFSNYSHFMPCRRLSEHDHGGSIQKVDFGKPAWWKGKFVVGMISVHAYRYQG